jgi:hypothetical protein
MEGVEQVLFEVAILMPRRRLVVTPQPMRADHRNLA